MSRKPVPAQAGDRARLEILFDKPQLLGRLFGEYDKNLVAIENRLGVYIAARGNKLQIEGEAEAAGRAREVLTGLYNRIAQGHDIDSGAVEGVIAMSAEPTLEGILRADVADPPAVMIRTRKKTIVPRSTTQVRYPEYAEPVWDATIDNATDDDPDAAPGGFVDPTTGVKARV